MSTIITLDDLINPRIKMDDKKQEEENSQTDSFTPKNSQPEFDVNIPDIQYTTEGYGVGINEFQKSLEKVKSNKDVLTYLFFGIGIGTLITIILCG